jgi:hypothetical protein
MAYELPPTYITTMNMWYKHHTNLEKMMSEFNEKSVYNLWVKKGEKRMETQEDYDKLEYESCGPLYVKMIYRLRSCNGNAIKFWNQIDPQNRQLMLQSFGIYELCWGNDQILNFLFWLWDREPENTVVIFSKAETVKPMINKYNTYVERV